MLQINDIITRLQSMTVAVVTSKDDKGYAASRKVADIVSAVQSGRSAPSRLATADKTLTKWGF